MRERKIEPVSGKPPTAGNGERKVLSQDLPPPNPWRADQKQDQRGVALAGGEHVKDMWYWEADMIVAEDRTHGHELNVLVDRKSHLTHIRFLKTKLNVGEEMVFDPL